MFIAAASRHRTLPLLVLGSALSVFMSCSTTEVAEKPSEPRADEETTADVPPTPAPRNEEAARKDDTHDSADPNPLVGAWHMTELSITENGKTSVQKADKSPLSITIYSPAEFAYVFKGAAIAGAGTYVYDGSIMTQTFDYIGDVRLEGSVWTFNLTLEGDRIDFSGPLNVISKAGEDITASVPQFKEIRYRVSR